MPKKVPRAKREPQRATGKQADPPRPVQRAAAGPRTESAPAKARRLARMVGDREAHRAAAATPKRPTQRKHDDKKSLQRAATGEPPTVTKDIERRLDAKEGKGEPLPTGIRRSMEGKLGDDLSDVRIHRDAEAGSLADRLDAKAFTTGRDVYFGDGNYRPGTRDGDELMAHELTHTVQQKRGGVGRVARAASVSMPGEPDEVEAERVARDVVDGDAAQPTGVARARLQRQPASPVAAPSAPPAAPPITDTSESPPASTPEPEASSLDLQLPGGSVALSFAGAKSGKIAVDLSQYSERIPGLRLGVLEARVRNGEFQRGRISAGIAVPFMQGDVTLEVDSTGSVGPANGKVNVEIPAFARGNLTWNYQAGSLSGTLVVGADEIKVPGLPIKDSSLTITLAGPSLSVSGEATTSDAIPGLSEGRLRVAYDNQRQTFAIAINAQLDVPGLDHSAFTIEKDEAGNWKGSGDVGASFAGASGSVHLEHENFRLRSGEGKIGYARGPLQGGLTVRLAPPEGAKEGALGISGEGDVTVQVAPWLSGTGHAVLYPDGNVDLSGALTFPNDIELFKKRRFEKTLWQFEQEFPLWGVVIPVVGSIGLVADIHAKLGVRTTFGPAVLRNIVVEGTYSTRGEKAPEAGGAAASGTGVPEAAPTPSFAISGEFFLPAGAELVIVVGGGVGLSALVAKLSGGIDLVGTAGAYTTLSVQPRFQYKDGKYSFRGVAELQAAALATLGVNAYAAARVGIGWLSKEVWRKDWNLASFVWDPGISLGMQASVDYTLGEPFNPNLEFKPVQIDPKRLIKSAMPDSGQPTPDKPRSEPPKAQMKLDPDPAAPAAAKPAAPPPDAGKVPGGAPGGKPGAAAPVGPTAVGSGVTTPIEQRAPEPVPFVPPRPSAADKQPEDRTQMESWDVFAWDTFIDDLEKRSGRKIHRASKLTSQEQQVKREAREAEMRDLEEAWKHFSKQSENPNLDEFKQNNADQFWNYYTNKWEKRRYKLEGDYKEVAWPLYVSPKKSGTVYPAIWPGDELDTKRGKTPSAKTPGWALGKYQGWAQAGKLVTHPRTPRIDVRDAWQKAHPNQVLTAADAADLPAPHDVDHIQELQLGGTNDFDNLQLLFFSDNRSSGSSLAGQIRSDMAQLQATNLKYEHVTGEPGTRLNKRKEALGQDEDLKT